MNNKKTKPILILIFVLTFLSVSMFVYQNFILPKHQKEQMLPIYIANKDIPPYSEVKKEDFDEVYADRKWILSTAITDFNKTTGKKLKGGLLKGELLTEVRLTDKNINENEIFITEIVPDYYVKAKEGDIVKVYVSLIDRNTDKVTVKLLFDNKKVLSINDNDKNNKIYLKLTEDEVRNYYTAKEVGKIIVVKKDVLDITKSKSDKNFNANTDAKKVKMRNGEEIAVLAYEVKAGDTLDSLALKFKTSKDTIIELNNGKTSFQKGEMILVPAI